MSNIIVESYEKMAWLECQFIEEKWLYKCFIEVKDVSIGEQLFNYLNFAWWILYIPLIALIFLLISIFYRLFVIYSNKVKNKNCWQKILKINIIIFSVLISIYLLFYILMYTGIIYWKSY